MPDSTSTSSDSTSTSSDTGSADDTSPPAPAPGGGRRRGGLAKRAGWSLADQMASSLSNFGAGILAAAALSAAEFGAFSVAYMTYVLILGASRAVATEPAAAAYTTAATGAFRTAWRRATGTSIAIGALSGSALALLGMAVGGDLGAGLIALAPCLPGLMLQDAWRYHFIAAKRAKDAFINDLIWGLLQIGGLMIATLVYEPSVSGVVFGWGLSGYAAALVGVFQARMRPRLDKAIPWLISEWRLGKPFLADFALLIGATQLTQYAVGAVAGLATLGVLRAGNILVRPPATLVAGARLFLVPELARIRHRRRRVMTLTLTAATLMGGTVIAWGLLLALIPDSLGVDLIGDKWEPARPLLFPLALALAATGAIVPPLSALRALERGSAILRARLVAATAQLVAGVGGAWQWGAEGAAWGLAIGGIVGLFAFWLALRLALGSDHLEPVDAAPPPPPTQTLAPPQPLPALTPADNLLTVSAALAAGGMALLAGTVVFGIGQFRDGTSHLNGMTLSIDAGAESADVAGDLAALIDSGEVLAPAAQRLGRSVARLDEGLTVVSEGRVLDLTYADADPEALDGVLEVVVAEADRALATLIDEPATVTSGEVRSLGRQSSTGRDLRNAALAGAIAGLGLLAVNGVRRALRNRSRRQLELEKLRLVSQAMAAPSPPDSPPIA